MASQTRSEHLVVEQSFSTPLSDEQHASDGRRLDDCLGRHGGRWLRSYLSTDRKRMVCEFEAPDADAVRTSYRAAGVPFDRVWTAEVYSRTADEVSS